MINLKDEDYDKWFEDLFIADLDSWFTADIVCCDNCYDDFNNVWPYLNKRDKEFYSIDVGNFYEGSKRLKFSYTEEEYLKFLHQIKCPRCESSLESNFWICNLEFNYLFEKEFEFYELQDFIAKKPFMVLENPIAKRTFSILKNIFNEEKRKKLDSTLYRGRVLTNKLSKEEFLPPTSDVVNEGRYNHIGIPVYYLANQKETCYKELREPKNNFYIAEIKIEAELNLLDLRNLDDVDNDDLLQAIAISSVLASKAKDDCRFKPEYYFSRFIADCCKYIGFDGIIYPSIQCNKGFNYVLFNTDIITIDNVIKYELVSNSTHNTIITKYMSKLKEQITQVEKQNVLDLLESNISVFNMNNLTNDMIYELIKDIPTSGNFIYCFSCKTIEDLLYLKKRFETIKTQGKAYAKFNKENTSTSILYIGSSHSLKQRIKEHLGICSKSTYALKLAEWARPCSIEVNFSFINFNTDRDLLKLIEYQYWDEYSPLFGQRK